MENKSMRFVLFFFLFINTSFPAVNRGAQDDLSRYRSEVMQLGARLSSLEKEIGSKNDLYLSSVDQIKQFEGDIQLYRDKLETVKEEVQESRKENRLILQNYIAQTETDHVESWQRMAHLELLKQAQEKLINKEMELTGLIAKVNDFDSKVLALKSTEEELVQMIQELELRKKTAMEQYMAKLEAKKKAENKVQNINLRKKLNVVKKNFSEKPEVLAKPDRFFSRPLEEFVSFSSSPKGVTYKYTSIQPIKAVGNGKVVFAGDLASYGQVVLIDHGDDIRTVILGRMNIKVEKNQEVKDGHIVAYTQADSSEAQNLYFEVRKKNTAQNTILWLEQSGVSKI